ncbi:aldehyde dehydrogenase family protein [Enterococcus montenegrensis]|uniref:aldehyde dehydrogenase family protein n=1 Tax=Enterococcus montenegrensis TaxID=3031993 RepID=UPI00249EF841|nr:aldehyde dehydrogenase family protein [Enterococcus montenegrensis]WHA09459.1 aldehyde dehydrogenase family protein [Enterococcus montenegrensis]
MKKPAELLDDKYLLYIDGNWTQGVKGETLTSKNPSDGTTLATFISAEEEDVDNAVKAATAAFATWSVTSVEERSKILLEIADVLEANAEKLAWIETYDNGKPLRETKNADIPLVVDHFRYFAALVRSEEGTIKELDEHTLTMVLKEPIGVVGQIVPWNFPLLMAAWKIAPALAAGNTIVIHPSSSTPLSLLEATKLIGPLLPKGVLNVITGKGSESGNYMLTHPGFAKIAFTGSTEVGYQVAKGAAKNLIPATLELGGKSAHIIFSDANQKRALEFAKKGILTNQGQVCSAGSRLLVQADIYDDFIAKLAESFEAVKVGLPWQEDTVMGSQINEGQVETILDYIDIGQKEGARVVTGGDRYTDGPLSQGAFVKPTILADVTNDMRVAQEEIFGPVIVVIKFETEKEAIAIANDSDYGLAGGVFTENINKAFRVARAVRTGTMWVNTYGELPAGTPFGGYKKSGIGRETYKTILDAYSQTKNIYMHIE